MSRSINKQIDSYLISFRGQSLFSSIKRVRTILLRPYRGMGTVDRLRHEIEIEARITCEENKGKWS